jgi:alpha-D-ribose 1-methylphosphonate 5-triphosphate synthase subunit PhnH
MTITSEVLSGGFSDPVFQSQSVFRMVMDGMARPGTIQTVAPELGQPAPLGSAAGAIALTLCDHETTVWLSGGLSRSSVGAWIGFHTGAPLTQEKAEARFAFLERGVAPASFSLFSLGSQDYPDRSTTIVLEADALHAAAPGTGLKLTLTGPGIQGSRDVWIDGLPENFGRLWIDNRALFPRGVDVIMTAGKELLCLPRTVKISL